MMGEKFVMNVERSIKMIKEIDGRFTCTLCDYEWSAMLGDEIQEKCECEEEEKNG